MSASATFAKRLEERDRRRFVGRHALLESLAGAIDGPGRIVFVHGPGGVGKSALLRELARRGERVGRPVLRVEGRELDPVADALEQAIAPALEMKRPIVLLDTYERMSALDGYLRRELLPGLGDDALILIGGRRAPAADWFQDGWDELMVAIELLELPYGDRLELVNAYGVQGDERAREIVLWAGGSPLALALAAQAAVADPDWSPSRPDPDLVRALIRRLVDAEPDGAQLSALGVAAIARVCTVELLDEALEGADGAELYAWLRERTFTEPLGEGLGVHELTRRALLDDLRRRDPERERELRRLIVDHLYARARKGRVQLSIDMAHLVQSEELRWGFGWEGSGQFRIDDVRQGDAEQVESILLARQMGDWWASTRRWFDEAPERVAVARDAEDCVRGYMVSASPRTAPEFAEADPLLGPWLAHARANARQGDSVLWRESIDFSGDEKAHVQAMLGMAGILRSGQANPRFAYLPVNPMLPGVLEFAAAAGGIRLPELDYELHGVLIECHRIDYGPGGLLAAQRAFVYRELGLPPPGGISAEAVRQALRDARVPMRLAQSELARGEGTEERCASVRRMLQDAAKQAFGETPNEQLLRKVLECGYLAPAGASHESTAYELNLSRAAYFRRLRVAAERVAQYLGAS